MEPGLNFDQKILKIHIFSNIVLHSKQDI